MITLADAIPLIALGLSGFAYLNGLSSQKRNEAEFKKLEEDSIKAQHLAVNPSWFVNRMRNDTWWFGLLTNAGDMIAIQRIEDISEDGKWLKVTLLTADELDYGTSHLPPSYEY